MKPPKSFRIDPELLKKAKEAKINVTQVIEAALAKVTKTRKCPYCNKGDV